MNARLLIVPVVLLLGACASHRVRDEAPMTLPPEAEYAPPPASEGAIFSSANGLALFEDQKAHRVGDILTILLVEKTQAEKKANTSTSKSTEATVDGPTLLGRPITAGGA